MGSGYLLTSESVAEGHPDKVADQIADAILDACLEQDSESRVACEVLITQGLVVLAGEITSRARVDYEAIARKTLRHIGYGPPASGFDLEKAEFLIRIHEQSPDISRGIDQSQRHNQGAGDQGLMIGYATLETPERMPLPIQIAHSLMREHKGARKTFPFLGPDGKTQVSVEYDEKGIARRVHTVVLSVQHDETISSEALKAEMKRFVERTLPQNLLDEHLICHINPTGRFVIGGPDSDTGLTGRKIIVDTYGGQAHHGGGAFSGKDGTKVDRSGAYMARFIAKHLVESGKAKECEVELAYAIGMKDPVGLRVNTFDKEVKREKELEDYVRSHFDLTPHGIIERLNLRSPFFQKTAFGGHFGRAEFPWEQTVF
jgi:S-adenosylmethionine synthetase